jgi:hypothetical protein
VDDSSLEDAADPVGGVISRVVVRCGAARVGSAKVVCIGEERADAMADIDGVFVRNDLIDPASEAVLVTLSAEAIGLSTMTEVFFGGTGFNIEIPSVPNTLLADRRRGSRLFTIPS